MRNLKLLGLMLILLGLVSMLVSCTGGAEDYPTRIPTKVEDAPPPEEHFGVPILFSPVNNAILDNGTSDKKDSIIWDFSWSEVPGATQYQLYVIGNGQDLKPVINARIFSLFFHSERQRSYIGDQNRFGWTWKVRAEINGEWIEWSEVRKFDVEPLDTDQPQPKPSPTSNKPFTTVSVPSPTPSAPSPTRTTISSTPSTPPARDVRVYTTPG
jgi:hypothetical protein